MGGLLAIHLAAESDDIAAAVAICPAAEWMLAEDVPRVLDGRPPPAGSALSEMRIDAPALATGSTSTTSRTRPSGWAPSRCS